MPDSSSQLVEISLYDRLSIAKDKGLSLLQDINWLKSLRVEKASKLSKLTWEFNQCQFEANVALSKGHMKTHHRRAMILGEIEWEKEHCLCEWKGLGTKLERFTAKLNELKKEISKLEEMVNDVSLAEGDRSPCKELTRRATRVNARLGRGLVFDDEIAAWQRMRPGAHPTQSQKQKGFQGSLQFRRSGGQS